MSRGPRVVVLALDGTDPDSIARHAANGSLPELAKVFGQARKVELSSLADVFLTSPWPCFASGVGVGNHGIHAFRPLRSGTLELVEGAEFSVPEPFWETAVHAGLRALVIDAPICGPPPADAPLEGLRFLEWGAHPPIRPAGSFPPELLSTMLDRYGPHPCTSDDPTLSTARSLDDMGARLCEGVRLREQIILDLLDEDAPDLVVASFAEAHIAGHQFLNLEDPGHPWHDPAVAAALGESPLRRVIEAIDAAMARILARLPKETTVLVICLGGLRVTYGGSQLLDDVLRRIGLTVSAPARRNVAQRLWHLVPARIRAAIARRLPDVASRKSGDWFRASMDWTATRAFALSWAYSGYLRINQRGREPFGVVAPGAESDALLDQIESVLSELTIAGTNEPAVLKVVRAQKEYPGRASAELPDLMVLWRDDGPLDAVESPRLGRIENRDHGMRPAHTNQGSLFAWGPGIGDGSTVTGGRDIDIAPTVLALLDLARPDVLDGRTLHELLQASVSAPA